jgi:hypothetical protein
MNGGDVNIRSSSPATEENPQWTLDPVAAAVRYRDTEDPTVRLWLQRLDSRLGEVSEPTRLRIAQQRARAANGGSPDETYRRIAVTDALHLLVSADAAQVL